MKMSRSPCCCWLAAVPQEARKPNIVFIHADDLGYGDLSCYGQKNFKTPSLDRMAAEGLKFSQYYAGNTVCAPSRCALMTGYHMGHSYIRGNADQPLRPEDVTVAELLKKQGYATAMIGKWGLGLEKSTGAPNRKASTTPSATSTRSTRTSSIRTTSSATASGWSSPTPRSGRTTCSRRETTDYVEKNKANPFFIYLNYTNPHAELLVPEDSLAEYRGKYPGENRLSAGPATHRARRGTGRRRPRTRRLRRW